MTFTAMHEAYEAVVRRVFVVIKFDLISQNDSSNGGTLIKQGKLVVIVVNQIEIVRLHYSQCQSERQHLVKGYRSATYNELDSISRSCVARHS